MGINFDNTASINLRISRGVLYIASDINVFNPKRMHSICKQQNSHKKNQDRS